MVDDGEEDDGLTALPATMSDIFFSLVAVVLVILLSLAPAIRTPGALGTHKADLLSSAILLEGEPALTFIAEVDGLRAGQGGGRLVPLDEILADEGLTQAFAQRTGASSCLWRRMGRRQRSCSTASRARKVSVRSGNCVSIRNAITSPTWLGSDARPRDRPHEFVAARCHRLTDLAASMFAACFMVLLIFLSLAQKADSPPPRRSKRHATSTWSSGRELAKPNGALRSRKGLWMAASTKPWLARLASMNVFSLCRPAASGTYTMSGSRRGARTGRAPCHAGAQVG